MMVVPVRIVLALFALLSVAQPASAEIFVRWDQDRVPSSQVLGAVSLVLAAQNTAGRQAAIAQRYRVYVEVPAASISGFTPIAGLEGVLVSGNATAEQLSELSRRLKVAVRALDAAAKWPHIRSNAVRRNNEVLQVTGRSQQPWIETNGALVRIRQVAGTAHPVLTYHGTLGTLAEVDEGPAVEDYLVAIAEAGTFGADLVLPLHARLQRDLLLDRPQARTEWNEIRRYIDFYSPARGHTYQPIANIGVVTAEPMRWFEVMNLLARHNLPFQPIAPDDIAPGRLDPFDLLVLLDEARGPALDAIAAFERKGGAVVRRSASGVGDPNAFAMKIRNLLGRERRAIDIWNGITVLTAPYQEADGRTVLINAINYAHQPLPVQLRVRGTFSAVRYECPEQPAAPLEYEHRNGYTEFVVPSLRVGGRILLSRKP